MQITSSRIRLIIWNSTNLSSHLFPANRSAIAGSSSRPLIIDGCPYQSCQIVHTGSRAIVLRDTTLHSYTAQGGAGDLYIEDSLLSTDGNIGVDFYPSQHIWARQLNLEQNKTSKFNCSGCKIWILGYKTESTPSIVLTEPSPGRSLWVFLLPTCGPQWENSKHLSYGLESVCNRVDPSRPTWAWTAELDNRKPGSTTLSLATRDVNSSQQLNMFYSYGSGGMPGAQQLNEK
jgi:hypothetical protein